MPKQAMSSVRDAKYPPDFTNTNSILDRLVDSIEDCASPTRCPLGISIKHR